MSKTTSKLTSGTKEWADTNVNIYSGCKHDCKYCYSKRMAIRFGRKTSDNNGWKTSISIEPFLDLDPIPLIKKLSEFVNESIWIGRLNYQKTEFNTLENVVNVVNRVRKLPEEIRAKMRFKDSIKNQLAKGGISI